MPELPEVETIRRGLKPHVTGQEITEVIVLRPSQLRNVTPAELSCRLKGESLNDWRAEENTTFFCSSNQVLAPPANDWSVVLSVGTSSGSSYKTGSVFATAGQLHFRDVRASGQIILLTDQFV